MGYIRVGQNMKRKWALVNTIMNPGFHNMSGIHWIAERLVTPQEESSCIELLYSNFEQKFPETQIVHNYVSLVIIWNSRGTSHDHMSYTSTDIS
jgi:hypothetical protein